MSPDRPTDRRAFLGAASLGCGIIQNVMDTANTLSEFGDRLGQVSGSARSNEEIARLATTAEEFSVHVVEVCRTCSWNHLVQSYVAGLPPQTTRRSRRVAK